MWPGCILMVLKHDCCSCVNHFDVFILRSVISLTDTCRCMGASAKNQQIANLKNTVSGWKKLIGRAYDDPLVQQEKVLLPYEVIQMENMMAGVKVSMLVENSSMCVYGKMVAYIDRVQLSRESKTPRFTLQTPYTALGSSV